MSHYSYNISCYFIPHRLHSGCQLNGRRTSEPMRSSTWLGEELTGKYYARLPEISLVEFLVAFIGSGCLFLRAVRNPLSTWDSN